MSHGRQPEVECFPFWRGFASYHGQEDSSFYVCDSTLQTRLRQNAPKREKYNFRLTSVAQKRLCLRSLIARSRSASKSIESQFDLYSLMYLKRSSTSSMVQENFFAFLLFLVWLGSALLFLFTDFALAFWAFLPIYSTSRALSSLHKILFRF